MLDFFSFLDDVVSSLFLLTDKDDSTGKARIRFFFKRMAVITVIVLGVVLVLIAVFALVNVLFLHW